MFERETYFMARELDQLQARHLPDVSDPAQFHASELRAKRGRPPFDALNREQRHNLIRDVYGVISESRARLFAVAMEKAATIGQGISPHPLIPILPGHAIPRRSDWNSTSSRSSPPATAAPCAVRPLSPNLSL